MTRKGIVVLALWGLLVLPSATTTAQEASTGEFVALTYNVAGLPEAISGGEEPSTNSPLISPLLNDYDLVLLQESWEEIHEVFEDLPIFYYHHYIVAEAEHPYQSEPAPHPIGTDLRQTPDPDDLGPQALNKMGPALVSDGLNRLSEFPFGELTRVMWDACYGSLHMTVLEEVLGALGLDEPIADILGEEVDGGATDCAAQKGFSVATTEFGPGVEVDVYNLHADAGGHPQDIAARQDNFEQLASYIRENSAGRPIILGGDTNLRISAPTREDRRVLDDAVWTSFLESTGLTDVCTYLSCPLEEWAEDYTVYDKFAFRSGGDVQITPQWMSYEAEKFTRDDGEPLSDHDPLAVAFSWAVTEFTGEEPVVAPDEHADARIQGAEALPATGGMGHAAVVAAALVVVAALGRLVMVPPSREA
jgi:hypothetical protein